ncbi:MAG: S26 family signal peptidase [Acidithiobacillus sp.]|nr:S26 family signal peptidase [Acidithiobacillus sp.]
MNRVWRKRLLWGFGGAILGALCLNAGVGIWMRHAHLVVNDSTCEPLGLYRLTGNPYPLHDGELVEVELPNPATHPAVAEGIRYHWFPKGQPWIKQIAALPGQTVKLTWQGVWVNGHYLPNSHVDRRTPGQRHAILHYPFGTYHLKDGQVWLYAPGNYAFDSAYYGPVSESHILQAARPYWTIPGSQYWLTHESVGKK